MKWPAFRWGGGGAQGAPVFLAHMKRNAIRCAGAVCGFLLFFEVV
jgi:hypothetical protein